MSQQIGMVEYVFKNIHFRIITSLSIICMAIWGWYIMKIRPANLGIKVAIITAILFILAMLYMHTVYSVSIRGGYFKDEMGNI